MKINCIINEGAANPRFISAVYSFGNNCACSLNSNRNFTRINGVVSKNDFKKLIAIVDNFKKLIIWAHINPCIH